MKPIVLVSLPLEPDQQQAFVAAAPGYRLVFGQPDSLADDETAHVVAVIGNLPPARLADYPGLRWVQLNSAGAEAYTQPGVLPPSTQLTNATGAYGLAIAEYMTAGVLMLLKKLHLYRDRQSSGRWEGLGQVASLWESRVLAVGLGDIGGQFAQRMQAMGAHVYGIRRSPATPPPYLEGLYTLEQLDDLLPTMDIVALSLPGTPSTAGLFDAARLARMKPGAILVNVGRGNAVDTDALAHGLKTGQLGGALLDVTSPEPLPPHHPLWQQSNAIITPHISGGYSLPETQRRVVAICLDNLSRYAAGQPLQNPVDFATGYRQTTL